MINNNTIDDLMTEMREYEHCVRDRVGVDDATKGIKKALQQIIEDAIEERDRKLRVLERD